MLKSLRISQTVDWTETDSDGEWKIENRQYIENKRTSMEKMENNNENNELLKTSRCPVFKLTLFRTSVFAVG